MSFAGRPENVECQVILIKCFFNQESTERTIPRPFLELLGLESQREPVECQLFGRIRKVTTHFPSALSTYSDRPRQHPLLDGLAPSLPIFKRRASLNCILTRLADYTKLEGFQVEVLQWLKRRVALPHIPGVVEVRRGEETMTVHVRIVFGASVVTANRHGEVPKMEEALPIVPVQQVSDENIV